MSPVSYDDCPRRLQGNGGGNMNFAPTAYAGARNDGAIAGHRVDAQHPLPRRIGDQEGARILDDQVSDIGKVRACAGRTIGHENSISRRWIDAHDSGTEVGAVAEVQYCESTRRLGRDAYWAAQLRTATDRPTRDDDPIAGH